MSAVMHRALLAPEPGWVPEADVVVVGSGIAGLTVAIHARRAGMRVMLVTKVGGRRRLHAVGPGRHRRGAGPGGLPDGAPRDTLVAGAGLCDEAAVAGTRHARGRPQCAS